jgi:hypothetical protein
MVSGASLRESKIPAKKALSPAAPPLAVVDLLLQLGIVREQLVVSDPVAVVVLCDPSVAHEGADRNRYWSDTALR